MCYINNSSMGEKELCNMFSYECQIHPVTSFENLNNFRKMDTLCDITIKVGPKCFRAHKVVLSSASPYFHAMFTTGLREGSAEEVELHGVDPDSVAILLDFIYTSKIKILEENVQLLLPASNILQLSTVREACCNFLNHQLDPCNALGILLFADTHNCTSLVEAAESYVLQNFVNVSQTEEFLTLSSDRMKYLLQSDCLVADKEASVYTALVKWIRHDITGRSQFLSDLLGCIRLPLLTRDFLMLTVEAEELIKSNPMCKDLLIEAMKYHLMPEMRRYLQTIRTLPRTGRKKDTMIYALGGQNLFSIHYECERFIVKNDSWEVIPSMAIRRARLGIGVIYNDLYAVGGFSGTQDLNSVEVYNTETKVWSNGQQMGTSRSCLGVTVLHNLLYAIGGFDGSFCLSSVERYDPLSNQWTSVAKMNSKRRYVSVSVLDEHIIAAGGYDGNKHLNSCEVYDPVSNVWTTRSPMTTQRSSAGGCVLNGYFYVSGGTDGSVIVTSVERYNMQTDQWTTVRPMSSVRMTHSMVVINNKLLAIGGNDGTTSLNSMEEYDPDKDVWVLCSPMNTRRSHIAAAVLMA
ncbi:kelch-like protein 17 [Hydractinia symbiolongicarpus]|uniref:kelch-like protein 17 n=1 Tax=Hydractinia symbiolongicarpus TaxID=13093 RepID=UPI0025509391|nr:kelch-like protein 17 [Hydractinia symbiolongicarpus]